MIQAKFNKLEIYELLVMWFTLAIKKAFLSCNELRQAIISSYEKKGISESQKENLLIALGLKDEKQPIEPMTNEEILKKINHTYDLLLLRPLDYYILINYCVYKGTIPKEIKPFLFFRHDISTQSLNINNKMLAQILKDLDEL